MARGVDRSTKLSRLGPMPAAAGGSPSAATRERRLLSLLLGVALTVLGPAAAAAQQDSAAARSDSVAGLDSARVTYRTQEVVFLSAGRAAGLAVGDTVDVLGPAGQVTAHAVVVSVAQRTASATLVPADAPVTVGQLVRFTPRPPTLAAAAAAPSDTGAASAATAPLPDTAAQPRPAGVARSTARWRGNFQVEQMVNSVGGPATVTSRLTTASLALTAPVAPWLTLATRSTTEWRGSSTPLAVPGGNAQTILYQAEARVDPPGSWWDLSLGRFVPVDAIGLGFIDGLRVEVKPGAAQRLGIVGGYAPDVFTLAPSTAVRRAGAYWALDTPALSGSLAGAAEWQDGARRRTWVSAQSYWNASAGLSLYAMTDLDYGAGWQSFRGFQVTDLSAGVRARLPLGFRGGLSVGTNQALRLWQLAQTGDTLPLPGRLTSFGASLGRDMLGSSVDLTATMLRRTTDPSATFQGTLTVFNRRFMAMASALHGDLFDYGSLLVRLPLLLASSRVSTTLALAASGTLLPGGTNPLWRYSVRPEVSWRLGGSLYLSTSADIGRYAGQSSIFIQGGLSYQLH